MEMSGLGARNVCLLKLELEKNNLEL